MSVSRNGYPPDGKCVVKLCPNARIHTATVKDGMIQIKGARWPTDMNLILCPEDEWEVYYAKKKSQ